jgi:nicotinate-nucleotide pyrophosphorylase (carboxylating)
VRTDESLRLQQAFADAMAIALSEDLGRDELEADVTTYTTVAPSLRGKATVYAKQDGVVCGLESLPAVYRLLDGRVEVTAVAKDGDEVAKGDVLATVSGPVQAILVGERSALNLIGHLSGIATNVRGYLRAAPGALLVDTRKTLPGLRLLQKYAVRVGGGSNHRFALWDGVLIKDTHIVAAGGVGEAVRRARGGTSLPVQAECQTPEEVEEALEAGAHAILLDNRTPDELRDLVARIKAHGEHILVEASGGVTLDTVGEIATTGVDRISVGAFTHSSPALDVSLELEDTTAVGEEA